MVLMKTSGLILNDDDGLFLKGGSRVGLTRVLRGGPGGPGRPAGGLGPDADHQGVEGDLTVLLVPMILLVLMIPMVLMVLLVPMVLMVLLILMVLMVLLVLMILLVPLVLLSLLGDPGRDCTTT